MKTIKIFLASSEELADERKELADLVGHLNHVLNRRDTNVQLVKWEYLDSSMGPDKKQEEYNRELRGCELCIVLFWTRFGTYTKAELDVAHDELCSGGNPKKLYVYFKDGDDISPDLKEFKDSFTECYGHYYSHFRNIDMLRADFLLQFMDYMGFSAAESGVVELRDGHVLVEGKEYVKLENVPFAGNNEEYKALKKNIEDIQSMLYFVPKDNPMYTQQKERLAEMQKKLSMMESNLWEQALQVTRLSTAKCSDRLERAMQLFNAGDNKGAIAVLDEVEIEGDASRNLNLIRLGEEGRAGLETNIRELKMRISSIQSAMSAGWIDEVVSLRAKVLSWTRSLYGENSAETADAMDAYGQAFDCKGCYDQSLEYILRSLEIRKEVFGERHPATATSLNNVGAGYSELGNNKKALEYSLQALEIRREVLGERHPDTAISLNNVGSEYAELGDHAKALEYCLQSLEISKKVLGGRHPDTAISLDNIGYVYDKLGDHVKALKYSLQALEIRKEVLGERHPTTAISLDNVGVVYDELGDHENAMKYRRMAMEIREDS